MVKVIIGRRGSGKTKMLIDMVNRAATESKGNVVCIEKNRVLTYNVISAVRLIETSDYKINSYEALYGFIAGIMARDYDATEIFLDSIKKIGGDDKEEIANFLDKIAEITTPNNLTLIVTLSYDISEIPDSIKKYVVNI